MKMKCLWSKDGCCELRGGIADDPSCNGSPEEVEECGYVDIEENEDVT